MSVFNDTSALYAIIDADDQEHTAASQTWTQLINGTDLLVTSNYVLLETSALLQSRIGIAAVQLFYDTVVPILHVLWVDINVHQQAVNAVLTAGRRQLSLVDCVSFTLMRLHSIDTAFTFDPHFAQQGFKTVP